MEGYVYRFAECYSEDNLGLYCIQNHYLLIHRLHLYLDSKTC